MQASLNTFETLPENETPVDVQSYQMAYLGCLTYATTATRPDLAAAVGILSKYMSRPGKDHWQGVKRVLCYIKGTLNHGLTFTANGSDPSLYSLYGSDLNLYGLHGSDPSLYGLYGSDPSLYGLYGLYGSDLSLYGLYGSDPSLYGLYGSDLSLYGLYDSDPSLYGLYGSDPSLYGLYGSDPSLYGLYGSDPSLYGLYGSDPSLYGLYGSDPSLYGLYGSDPSLYGLYGSDPSLYGLYGSDPSLYGLYGSDPSLYGSDLSLHGSDPSLHGLYGSDPSLYGYSVADWGGDVKTRCLTSEYVFLIHNNTISWCSKRQTSVSRSTTRAGYIALSTAHQEIVWLRRLLSDIGLKKDIPLTISEDNQGAMKLSRNPKFHNRTKHIDVSFHFIREQVNCNIVSN